MKANDSIEKIKKQLSYLEGKTLKCTCKKSTCYVHDALNAVEHELDEIRRHIQRQDFWTKATKDSVSAKKLGLSKNDYLRLKESVITLGGSDDFADSIISKMHEAISKAAPKGAPPENVINLMGLDPAELKDRTAAEQFAIIRERIKDTKNDAHRTAFMHCVFGFNATPAIPLLEKNNEAIDTLLGE